MLSWVIGRVIVKFSEKETLRIIFMSEYNVFILISKKYLQAGYYHNGEIVPISIDGNEKITYNSDKDFDKLIESMKDTFNIDDLDDISVSTDIDSVIQEDGLSNKKICKNM